MDPNRRALDVAGRSLPVLPFPLIHVQPHGVAVGANELGVDVDECLRPVVAGRKIAQALDGIAKRRAVDGHGRTGRDRLDVDGEQWHAVGVGLLNGRAIVGLADRHVDAAGHGPRVRGSGERDRESWFGGGREPEQ